MKASCRRFSLLSFLALFIFVISAYAQPGSVRITEVMYDDTASTDLEWAEIYNTTASSIDISGWVLLDAGVYPGPGTEGLITVPAATSIAAGQYLVLSRLAIPEFAGEVVCTQTGSWGLTNSGDNLALYTDNSGSGTLIDGSLTVSYPDSSANNAGNSIEKCDPSSAWAATGWHQSTNIFATSGRFRRCTPGTANSPCPAAPSDTTRPFTTTVSALNPTTVVVTWSEPVQLSSSETTANYSLDNGVGNPLTAVRSGANNNIVTLTFASLANTFYILTTDNVQDTASNVCLTQVDTFSVNFSALVGDVVISEVMYDDTAGSDVEWVELHNTTASSINLSGMVLLDAGTFPPSGSEGAIRIPNGTVIAADAYLVLSLVEIPEITDEVICMQYDSTFALSNSGDNIALYSDSSSGVLVDGSLSVTYPDISPNNSGRSIEKCDANALWSGNVADWHISTNVFAASGRYRNCTPGAANSPCIPDTVGPTIVSATPQSATSVDVLFDEELDATTANTEANYSGNLGLGVPTSSVLLGDLRTVRLIFATAFAPNTYTLTINNVSDLVLNPILANSQVQFTIEAPTETLIVTEFMANPSAVSDDQGEWFELYNAGHASVNLENWIVADASGSDTIEGALTINPGEYLVFSNNADSATNGGVPEDYAFHFGTSGWGLALSNTADQINIKNPSGFVISALSYTGSYPFTSGHSAQLIDLTYNPAIDSNWCEAQAGWIGSSGDFGTPGEATVCAGPAVPDTLTVCQARSQGGCGETLYNNALVYLRGVVTSVDTCRPIAYLESEGCAIAIFGNAVLDTMGGSGRHMEVGDSIAIEGRLTQFRGLTEVQRESETLVPVTYLGAGVVPAAVGVSAATVKANADSCEGESYESRIVSVLDLTFVNAGGLFSVADSNYAATSGSDTVWFRVESCSPVLGDTIPAGPVMVTAVLGQYDSTSTCLCGGYQLIAHDGSGFASANCEAPVELTVTRIGLTDNIELRWQPGLNQTCTCFKIYSSSDGSAVYPVGYSQIAAVSNGNTYTDSVPLSQKVFYVVVADGNCP